MYGWYIINRNVCRLFGTIPFAMKHLKRSSLISYENRGTFAKCKVSNLIARSIQLQGEANVNSPGRSTSWIPSELGYIEGASMIVDSTSLVLQPLPSFRSPHKSAMQANRRHVPTWSRLSSDRLCLENAFRTWLLDSNPRSSPRTLLISPDKISRTSHVPYDWSCCKDV